MIALTHAFGPLVRTDRILRGVALLNRQDVLVQDEIHLDRPLHVTWAMHTRAQVAVNGRTATLTQNGKTLVARLLLPAKVTFEAGPAPSLQGQQANTGVTKLMIHFEMTDNTQIAVLFAPGTNEPQVPKLTPVSDWPDEVGLAKGSPAPKSHAEPKPPAHGFEYPPPPIRVPAPRRR